LLESRQDLTPSEQNKLRKLKELESIDTDKLREQDQQARQVYNQTIDKTYYTSKNFLTNTIKEAGISSLKMGVRQVIGLFFTECWLEIKDRFPKVVSALKEDFSFSDLFHQVGDMIKSAFGKATSKFKDLIASFKEGAISGFLSSIATTIINIFFTTAKNGVRIIRQLWSYIVQIVKILVVNPNGYTFGEKMKEVSKLLVMGVSTVLGIIVEEAISKIPVLNAIPIVNKVVPIFCGTMVTGLLSVTIMYFIDNSSTVSSMISFAKSKFDEQFEVALENIKIINRQLDEYTAKLLDIDFQALQDELSAIGKLNQDLIHAKSISQFNDILYAECNRHGVELQFHSFEEFDRCMLDDDFVLEL
jgi:hypothetical protein